MTVKIFIQSPGLLTINIIDQVTCVKPIFKHSELIGLEVDGVKYIDDYFTSFEISENTEENV